LIPPSVDRRFLYIMEIWIKYQNDYEVSSFGNIKSLKFGKEKILKPALNNYGYLTVVICNNGMTKTRNVHQLVAECFLNHIPSGHKLVVNHINFNKIDNRVENLEIITARENLNKKHLKSSSQYTGVSWCKTYKKWVSSINIKGKKNTIGRYNTEI